MWRGYEKKEMLEKSVKYTYIYICIILPFYIRLANYLFLHAQLISWLNVKSLMKCHPILSYLS